VGQLSNSVTVTLTNPSGDLSLTDFTLAVTAGFQLVSNTCPSTLAAGQSCTTGVEFAPTSAGSVSGSLTAGSSVLATGVSVPLSGMGFSSSIASTGSSTQTVANGQTADYDLTITPLGGSQGTFTFQCSLLPPYASCTFSPASLSVPANSTGYEVVGIATGVSSSSAHLSRSPVWPVLPLVCGLVLLPFGWRRRRKILLLAALLLVLAGGVSSCTSSGGGSGGSGGQGGSSGTPAGTYSIPVSAAAAGVQHSVTLTLTVD